MFAPQLHTEKKLVERIEKKNLGKSLERTFFGDDT